jgi:hypothetical protein
LGSRVRVSFSALTVQTTPDSVKPKIKKTL